MSKRQNEYLNLNTNILGVSLNELIELDHACFGPSLKKEEYNYIFKSCDALWLHSGNPTHPHAGLTSGGCSNGFVDTLRVLHYTNLCKLMAHMIVYKFRENYKEKVDWVIGSSYAAITLSFAVAELLNAEHGFTEKGHNKTQVWKRLEIFPGQKVLQVEELITKTTTLEAVRCGIREGNPNPVQFIPFVITLIHRSEIYEIEGSPILHLIHYDIENWTTNECPLCKKGSKKILEPKKHWKELTNQ